jgi:BirA family biotin operon repressor/biotin-[acetyl-CoA-carboxylase] ligase
VDLSHPGTRFRIRDVGSVGSTNTLGLEAAASGEAEGLVIVADHQTAGRGRLGRTWEAPPGSALLMSVLLRPPPDLLHFGVTAVGCAAAAACGSPVGLKWPNDLVAGGLKLGGVLAEVATDSGKVGGVVVGLGLNLTSAPVGAVFLDDVVARPVGRGSVLAALLTELEARYTQLVAAGPAALLEEYRQRCVTIGQEVRVEQARGVLAGRADGIDDGGRLTVALEGGGVAHVDVGDVVHLRPA